MWTDMIYLDAKVLKRRKNHEKSLFFFIKCCFSWFLCCISVNLSIFSVPIADSCSSWWAEQNHKIFWETWKSKSERDSASRRKARSNRFSISISCHQHREFGKVWASSNALVQKHISNHQLSVKMTLEICSNKKIFWLRTRQVFLIRIKKRRTIKVGNTYFWILHIGKCTSMCLQHKTEKITSPDFGSHMLLHKFTFHIIMRIKHFRVWARP